MKLVAVDFTRDDLDERLANAGHNASRPTTWIWEGVVMYLTPSDVEATLRIVAKRSAPRSRLAIVYIAPGNPLLPIVALALRRVGEPLRSRYRAAEMRALLERHGFTVRSDESLPESAARMAPAVAKASRRVKHMRTVIADR